VTGASFTYERGLVRIDASALATASAPQIVLEADEPAAPPPTLRRSKCVLVARRRPKKIGRKNDRAIQFSRGLDAKSINGAIRSVIRRHGKKPPTFQTAYDPASRAVTMKFLAPWRPERPNRRARHGEVVRRRSR
jgi:hypothetical protein